MSVSSILAEAASALRHNRQRSILTTICLAWGVACFVILYSYGEGFDKALTMAFRAVGHDLILMFNGQTSTQAGGEKAGRRIRHGVQRRRGDSRCRAHGGIHFSGDHVSRRHRRARLSHPEPHYPGRSLTIRAGSKHDHGDRPLDRRRG